MKRIICLVCIAFLFATALVGCNNVETDQMIDYVNVDEIIDYTITKSADYIATTPEDLYEIADVVVVGSFEKTVATYTSDNSFPVTQVTFKIDGVHKGATSTRNILVEYYGGTVSMSDYLRTLTKEQIEKRGLDVSAKDVTRMTVTYGATKESVKIDESETYMLFLSYDAKRDAYFILSDGYGVCKMANGLIYSLAEEKFVSVNFEKK